jgi:hypothetical protein
MNIPTTCMRTTASKLANITFRKGENSRSRTLINVNPDKINVHRQKKCNKTQIISDAHNCEHHPWIKSCDHLKSPGSKQPTALQR